MADLLPDVLLLDVTMPGDGGIVTAGKVAAAWQEPCQQDGRGPLLERRNRRFLLGRHVVCREVLLELKGSTRSERSRKRRVADVNSTTRRVRRRITGQTGPGEPLRPFRPNKVAGGRFCWGLGLLNVTQFTECWSPRFVSTFHLRHCYVASRSPESYQGSIARFGALP